MLAKNRGYLAHGDQLERVIVDNRSMSWLPGEPQRHQRNSAAYWAAQDAASFLIRSAAPAR